MPKLMVATIAAAITICTVACNNQVPTPEKPPATSNDSLVKRGQYLVTITGCNDCHSPKKMGPHGPELDPDLLLSGYRSAVPFPKVDTNIIKQGWAMGNPEQTGWAGPWGASFAANLTSDATGIGNWTEEQFKKALTEGKWKGMDNTRPLLPPMPWQNYRAMSDDDVRAIFAYLKSTKPVANVEPSITPFAAL